jgi:hypothetical protein
MSVAGGADEAGFGSLYSPIIHGVEGTYIIDWARANNLTYTVEDGEIRELDAFESAWLLVPYQYVIKTGTGALDGLPLDASGSYYFILDGGGGATAPRPPARSRRRPSRTGRTAATPAS